MSSFIPTYNTAYIDKVGKTTFQEEANSRLHLQY